MNIEFEWIVFVTSLPTSNANLRMRLWRAMKAAGAVGLRDGVWLLPAAAPQTAEMQGLATELLAADGQAEVLQVQVSDPAQAQRFRQSFGRSAEYAALLAQITGLHGCTDTTHISPRLLGRLRREWQQISAIDFFPDANREAVEQALAALVRKVQSGEPQAVSTAIPLRDCAEYQARQWATRARPWVDRLASAWLVGRFIDLQARFLWLAEVAECPAEALGFDFDGAAFTHVGAKVTFEVLLASFALDLDPALQRLGRIVHLLDAGGEAVAEAAGLEAVLGGLRLAEADDDALLSASNKIFDSLYLNFQQGVAA